MQSAIPVRVSKRAKQMLKSALGISVGLLAASVGVLIASTHVRGLVAQ